MKALLVNSDSRNGGCVCVELSECEFLISTNFVR